MGQEAASVNTTSQPGDLINQSSAYADTPVKPVGTITPSKENLQVAGTGVKPIPTGETKKNWWTGEGFSADHILAQASADDPSAIGAGTLFGGKKGGGIGGLIGGTLRGIGAGMSGAGDPTLFTESSLYKREPSVEGGEGEQAAKSAETGIISDAEAAPAAIDEGYKVQESEAYKQNFRETFATNRAQRQRTFKWIAEDGIEREYNTMLEGETDEEWNNFLNNTANNPMASDSIDELIANEITSMNSDALTEDMEVEEVKEIEKVSSDPANQVVKTDTGLGDKNEEKEKTEVRKKIVPKKKSNKKEEYTTNYGVKKKYHHAQYRPW